jgi:hypothetical protein
MLKQQEMQVMLSNLYLKLFQLSIDYFTIFGRVIDILSSTITLATTTTEFGEIIWCQTTSLIKI